MAALKGVKTIDMLNGEITKVAYNGVEYAKVDNPKAGDIGVVTRGWGHQEVGDYYEIIRISESLANTFAHVSGRNGSASAYVDDFVYFRKISVQETPTIAEVNEKVDGLAERVTALEGGKSDKPAKEITHNGVEYTLVDRKAQAGDVIIFRKSSVRYVTVGKAYDVNSDLRFKDDEGDNIHVYDGIAEGTTETVLVYAPKAEGLKVGDYAKVITEVDEHKVGDIVKITKINNGYYDFKVDRVGYGDYGFIFAKDIEKISDEEGEKAFKQAVRDAIFTKAGRKPNEYRKGDIVLVTGESSGEKFYGEIGGKNEAYSDNRYYFTQFGRSYGNTDKADDMTIITFAESRLDLRK